MDNDAKTMLLGIAVILAGGFQWVASAVRGWSTDSIFVGIGLVITAIGFLYGLLDGGPE